jgi:DNA-binding response OmpR family regulator
MHLQCRQELFGPPEGLSLSSPWVHLVESRYTPFRHGPRSAMLVSASPMNLKTLLLSSDDKTIRVLRRVLGDLEIGVEHFSVSDDVIRRITRQRFEAIIVDCSDPLDAGNVLRAAKAAPVNKRALSVVLVESQLGLKGGFDMGAHFVLHKPLAVERAKSSFRAVRALMKSERRLQLRIPVQIPVDCFGSARSQAKMLDICEGGMALKFSGRKSRESVIRFSFQLPGLEHQFEVWGEMAWEANAEQAGVRFKDLAPDQRTALRQWLDSQLAEPVPDDPPVVCRLTDLSAAGCYLKTTSPFPASTRVILSIGPTSPAERAVGVVRISHPEFGMGVEFLKSTADQRQHVSRLIEVLRANGESLDLFVEPNGLETSSSEEQAASAAADDALVNLFHQQAHLPVEAFLEQMQQHRQLLDSR